MILLPFYKFKGLILFASLWSACSLFVATSLHYKNRSINQAHLFGSVCLDCSIVTSYQLFLILSIVIHLLHLIASCLLSDLLSLNGNRLAISDMVRQCPMSSVDKAKSFPNYLAYLELLDYLSILVDTLVVMIQKFPPISRLLL